MTAQAHKVKWLVQRPPPGDDSPTCGLLERACATLGLPFESIDVTPGKPVSLLPPDGPTVVHGRKTLIQSAVADRDYRRAVFSNDEMFTPAAYLRGWGRLMLNSDQQLLRWSDALRAVEAESLFVRPNDDDKLFTGRVFSAAELQATFEAALNRGLTTPDDVVVVAAARDIDAEARLFVVEDEIVSGSFYRPDADNRLPDELIAFADAAISKWRPHVVFALDIARADGIYRIVEANCFNGSRFYGSDVVKIVERVSAYQWSVW